MEASLIETLKPHKEKLVILCERLLGEGTPTTQFMRLINMDIQFHAKVEVPSPDDFYCRSKNPKMIEVLNWLGFDSTPHGVCYLTPQIKN
jgi:hypothetical protein